MGAKLEHWHDFYLLAGTAGATLVALLFVAVSLGAGFLDQSRAAPTRAFYSPVIVHFTAVLFLSAIALVPEHRAGFFAAMIGACAAIGFFVSAFVIVELQRHDWTNYKQDHLAYALLPALAYLALLIAARLVWTENDIALDVLAGSLLVLLVVNIRNAWDLTLTMVQRHSTKKRK